MYIWYIANKLTETWKNFLLFFFICKTIAKTKLLFGKWQVLSASSKLGNIVTDKAVARISFPSEFRLLICLFFFNKAGVVFAINQPSKNKAIILPNADGGIEQFEAYEASNLNLHYRQNFRKGHFPEEGVTDRYATLKLSISLRKAYRQWYSVQFKRKWVYRALFSGPYCLRCFQVQKRKISYRGRVPTTKNFFDASIKKSVTTNQWVYKFLAGELKNHAPYSLLLQNTLTILVLPALHIGLNLVLAAVNATLTRCNGCYWKRFGVTFKFDPASTNVFYYDPNTDPYLGAVGAGGAWNGELQQHLLL